MKRATIQAGPRRVRKMVDDLCAAIDRGEVTPTEDELLILAAFVKAKAGPAARALLEQLARRCAGGRAVLKAGAQ